MKKAPKTPVPAPAPATMPFTAALNELRPKLHELFETRTNLAAEQKAAEDRGDDQQKPAEIKADDELSRAMSLLNGSANLLAPTKKKRRYSDIIADCNAVERAIAIGQKLYSELEIKARAELADARREEFSRLQAEKAHLLLQLERVEQDLEVLTRGTVGLENYILPTGRLRNTSSNLTRCLETMVRRGFLSQAVFDENVTRSREADPRRQ